MAGVVALTLLAIGGRLGAQQPEPVLAPIAAAPAVSPLLPVEHWATEAVRRADALGLVAAGPFAQRAVPRLVVANALREAAARAPVLAPELATLTRGWLARFTEEFPETGRPDGAPTPGLWGSAVAGGYVNRTGAAGAGAGLFGRLTGAEPLADEVGAVGGVSLAASAAPFLSVAVEPRAGPGGGELERWDVVAGWHPVSVAVGRQPVGYGWGTGGGVVLSGAAVLDRIEVQTAEPVRFPSWFGVLGPISAHAFLSRFSERRHPGDPFFWGARVAIRPHPRVTLAVHRAAVFGGDSSATPVTVPNVLRMLVGRLSADFENQVVAVEGRYRAPTESLFPLTLYFEWGAEDAAGSWWDVPGLLLGAVVPSLPGLPGVGIGAEFSSFSASCCGNPPWYRHAAHPGGWGAGTLPLGHPLGGQGTELLVYGSADLFDARLRLDGRAFQRDRGSENLYVPGREGGSTGFVVRLAWRFLPRANLDLSTTREQGTAWTEQSLQGSVAYFF